MEDEISKKIMEFNVEERNSSIDYSKVRSLEHLTKKTNQLLVMNATQIPITSSLSQTLFLPRDHAMREGKFNGVNYAASTAKQIIKYANRNISSTNEIFEKFSNVINQCKNEFLNFKALDNKPKTIKEFNYLQTRASILIYLWEELEGLNM